MSKPGIIKSSLTVIKNHFYEGSRPTALTAAPEPLKVPPGCLWKLPGALSRSSKSDPLTFYHLLGEMPASDISWEMAAALGSTVPCPGLHCSHKCSHGERGLSFPLLLFTYSLNLAIVLKHAAYADQVATFYHREITVGSRITKT